MSDTLLDELSAIKDVEDTVVGNKVANFAYDDYAYEHNDANGVDTYNVNNHQNIPNGTASIMKVNSTILTKGWRAQASAITRMAMNHFLGRVSYNLNKLHDNFSGMLNNLVSYIGQPNGLATLDSEGKVALLNNVVNTGDTDTPTEDSTDKFTAGGAYTIQQAVNGKAPTNHASSSTEYGHATSEAYGHVKIPILNKASFTITSGNTISITGDTPKIFVVFNRGLSSATITVNSGFGFGTFVKDVIALIQNGSNVSFAKGIVSNDSSYGSTSWTFTLPASSYALVIGMKTSTGFHIQTETYDTEVQGVE